MDADTPNFSTMTGKECDACGATSGIDAPEGWDKMKVAEKRAYLTETFAPKEPEDQPEPPAYDITAEIRRFKDRRAHISAYDTAMLAEALGLPDARTLPYERLTRAIRRKIERL